MYTIVDHNTIGATEQRIWHRKLSDWLNFNRKFLYPTSYSKGV